MTATNLLPRTLTLNVKVSILLLAMALFAGLAPCATTLSAAPRADARLLAFAAANPGDTLQVIVRRAAPGAALEPTVRALGGEILQDLSIIDSFSARVPAHAFDQLARTAGVAWISPDAPVVKTDCTQCISTTNLANAYIRAIRADTVWNTSPYRQGQGVGVAVVDSGVNPQQDLYTTSGANRLLATVAFNNGYNQSSSDGYGHGNHVAGIIAGNGSRSNGAYIGVAPMANLVSVKVSDDQGGATASNVVAGLQWILNNKSTYNIRVVNLSLNSTVAESYNTNPIDAAVEILWFNKIVVVVSAGNQGVNALYPPANDPFAITVGAADDLGTASIGDDTIPSFSAYGTTTDGFAKPDLVAPGRNIVALMGNLDTTLAKQHPANMISINGAPYFRMSGTSMSAPMVAGAAALLLQDEPALTPDQVKYRLKATANKSWAGYSAAKAGAGYLDVYAAMTGSSISSANTNIAASRLLWSGSQALTWSSVNWNSVNWNSVNWNSVNWNSVNWNSVNWNSDYWQ
jgi:serine protease AprX